MGIDLLIILAYFVIVNVVGVKYSGKKDVTDYFLGGRSLHWTIACFSIVATETSALTFISIPGLAYVSGLGFLQLTFGYLAGRIFVAFVLLPGFFEGKFETVYQFLERSFGAGSKKFISALFHITRVLADSVRLYATAIPLTILMGWDYKISIIVIGIAAIVYTYYGGIKSVMVVDVLQLALYIACAILGIYLVSSLMQVPIVDIYRRIPADKLEIFSSGCEGGWINLFRGYNAFSGILAGAILSFASHGTDHLIVQRVLACGDTRSAQKAMIASGVMIIFQFALFMLLGLYIRELFAGTNFTRSDEIIPHFIANYVPNGYRGLMLAGIFATAMSTHASAINSLSSSTVIDLLELRKKEYPEKKQLLISRLISIVWAVVIVVVSIFFKYTSESLVIIALSIVSITYGGIMGIFIMGRFVKGLGGVSAMSGVGASIPVMIGVALFSEISWLWYVAIGFAVSLIVGFVVEGLMAAAGPTDEKAMPGPR